MRNKTLLLSKENQDTENTGSQKEQEITIYAEIGNPEGLLKALSSEEQVQAEVKVDGKRRMRVRKTIKENDETTYELTTKRECDTEEGVRSFIEVTKEISPEAFEAFKDIVVAYQHKKRYFFQIEKMKIESGDQLKFLNVNDFRYEVDVFFNKEGQPGVWCKIDVEIQDLEKQLSDFGFDVDSFNVNISASKLPFEPKNFILMNENTSEEDKAKISELYDQYFLITNP